jgi:hypothetical protein
LEMNTTKFQMPPLIGPHKEKFQELKTKEVVDHAGHSLLLELFNHGLFSNLPHGTSQNNNLLIAQEAMETKDATVDGHQTLLNMSKTQDYKLNLLIHMLLKTKDAK